jgi:nicotinate-nucleotide pyrophosphorylase (carboxylating)
MKIDEIIIQAIKEDIGDGDHTSLATIPANSFGKALLIAKESGILAGVGIAQKVYQLIDPSLIFTTLADDGSQIKSGDILFRIEGKSISILAGERLSLNFLQRMSGIATFTRLLVKQIEGTHAKLLDTRKTSPLLREIEKYAVKIGGGENHRMGLYDMIMIKDNHIDFAGGIVNAINATKKYLDENGKNLKIEIEVRNFVELKEVMDHGGVDRIMLDNFTPQNLKKAVGIIQGKFETEASGGINLNTIRSFAETGVDYISAGALTHQIKSLDLSLIAVK